MAENRELFGPPVKKGSSAPNPNSPSRPSALQRHSAGEEAVQPVIEIMTPEGKFVLSPGTVAANPAETASGVGGQFGQALDQFFRICFRLFLVFLALASIWGLMVLGYWTWARSRVTWNYRISAEGIKGQPSMPLPRGRLGYLMHAEAGSRWVKFFDFTRGSCLRAFRVPERYTSVAASPDQRLIVAQQVNDPTSSPAVVLRVDDGRQIARLTGTGSRGFAFHPSLPRLLHFSDQGLRTYDLNTGKLADEAFTFNAYPGTFQSNRFRDASCPRLTLSGQNMAWVSSGHPRIVTYPYLKEAVWLERSTEFNCKGVAFSPDGHYLIGLGLDGSLPVWNTETGRLFRVKQIQEDRIAKLNIMMGKSNAQINDVAFQQACVLFGQSDPCRSRMPYNSMMAVAWSGGVEVWDLSRGVIRDRLALDTGATSVWITGDGSKVIARTPAGDARVWLVGRY